MSPDLSILTPTYNRHTFLEHTCDMILRQTVDLARIEWVVVDDGEEPITPKIYEVEKKIGRLVYVRLKKREWVGVKRNIAKQIAQGKVLVHMDDDDYYHDKYVETMATTLLDQDQIRVVGATSIYFIFPEDPFLRRSGPFHPNHTCAGIMAYNQDYATTHFFDTSRNRAEEKTFLMDYREPVLQIPDSFRIYIPLAHSTNTVNKSQMLRVKTTWQWPDIIKGPPDLLLFYNILYPRHCLFLQQQG